jgi:penicillin-binding protein 1A
MTGGSVPAMVWQRLMASAHRDIELKPIPGIENPFVDAEVAAEADEAEKKRLAEAAAEVASRPAELSRATTRLLFELSETFRTAPPILDPEAKPATLSAL